MSEPVWTLETLKEHFDALRTADKDAVTTALSAAEKAVAAAMAASEKAILKAENAADKRAEASNEIRAAMVDQQKNFSNKEQTDMRLKMLEDAMALGKGRVLGVSQIVGMIGGGIVMIGIIIGIVVAVSGGKI